MPHLPGADEKEKFAPIFDNAPLWLVWFTWADATMEALELPPRDRSEICRFRRSRDDFFKCPALPSGIFENTPISEAEVAERQRTSEEADVLWDELADEIAPVAGF